VAVFVTVAVTVTVTPVQGFGGGAGVVLPPPPLLQELITTIKKMALKNNTKYLNGCITIYFKTSNRFL